MKKAKDKINPFTIEQQSRFETLTIISFGILVIFTIILNGFMYYFGYGLDIPIFGI